MQNASIIARRLQDGQIQYVRNIGSHFNNVASELLEFYNTSQRVERLFSTDELGQSTLWAITERAVFHQYPLVSHCYFYDLDGKWYYITSGPFHIKVRLTFIYKNLSDEANVFDFISSAIEKALLQYILGEYGEKNPRFDDLCDDELKAEMQAALECVTRPFYKIFELYPDIYVHFDDWAVVEVDEKDERIVEFKVRTRTYERQETIEW